MERYTGYPVAGSGPNAHETGPANAYGHGNAQRGDLTRPQDASFANSKATPSHNARPTKRENVGSARTEAKKERRKGKGKPGGHRGGNRGKPQTPNLRAHQKGGDRWAFNNAARSEALLLLFPNGGPTHIRAHHLPDKALQEKAITEAHALAARVDVIEHDTAKKARKYLRYVQREYRKEVGEDMGDDGDDGEE